MWCLRGYNGGGGGDDGGDDDDDDDGAGLPFLTLGAKVHETRI